MKKLISLLIALLFLLSPALTFAQNASLESSPSSVPKSSFELFWPITAGRLPDDSLYFLKTLRENIGEFFSFGSDSKANYHLTLSKKRLVEGEALIKKQNYNLAKATIQKSIDELAKSSSLAANSPQVKATIVHDGQTEADFLKELTKQLPTEQQSNFVDLYNKILSALNGSGS